MSPAIESSLGIVAYLALFVAVAVAFLFVSLLVGRLVRPANPHGKKLETYECGEPTVGSSFAQFDLRFYVVALLFIIFDVEVAFFFPWAVVFGKATNMTNMIGERLEAAVSPEEQLALASNVEALQRELGVGTPAPLTSAPQIREGARQLALITVVDIIVFFAVLLVGFAYVWRRGDLDWVRAVSRPGAQAEPPSAAGGSAS
jgi:NADH-quinone oxidoreductase subunit A